MAVKRTMKRRKSSKRNRRMYGGSAFMPADAMAPHDIGNFAASQQQAGAIASQAPDLSIIQSGGRSRRKGRGRRQRGGMHMLNPTDVEGSTGLLSTGAETSPAAVGDQKGGYFQSLLEAAVVPLGLVGLNKYAHQYVGRTPYKGKSRLSKRLRSHRNRR